LCFEYIRIVFFKDITEKNETIEKNQMFYFIKREIRLKKAVL